MLVVRVQAFRLRAKAPRGKRGAIKREFREFREVREVREALPTFIPKFPTLIKLPNKLASSQQSANFLSEGA